MKNIIITVLIAMCVSLCACHHTEIEQPNFYKEYSPYEVDVYVSDSEKEKRAL